MLRALLPHARQLGLQCLDLQPLGRIRLLGLGDGLLGLLLARVRLHEVEQLGVLRHLRRFVHLLGGLEVLLQHSDRSLERSHLLSLRLVLSTERRCALF